MSLQDLVKKIFDRPITENTKDLFVDRTNELLELSNLVDYYEGGIIGVAGERGIGKTTLFNMLSFKGKDKYIIKITDRETKFSVISNIIFGLYNYCILRGYKQLSKQFLNIYKELTTLSTKKLGVGFSSVISVSGQVTKQELEMLQKISLLLKEPLAVLAQKSKVVFILDEIDKDREEEILLILDAIKDAFYENNITLLISLPYSFYKKYRLSIQNANELYNVENVFDSVFILEKLPDMYVEELVRKRIFDYIDKEAIGKITLFANGNPRKAVVLLKESGFLASIEKKQKLSLEKVNQVIYKYMRIKLEDLKFSELQRKILQNTDEIKRADLVKKLSDKLRRNDNVIYHNLGVLEQKGILIIKNNNIILSRLGTLIKEIL